MPDKNAFILLAEYNQTMNMNLYNKALELSDTALHKDRGAYFGSIIATLNHILVGDIIWLKRFSSGVIGLTSLDRLESIPQPSSLRDILHSELAPLTTQRQYIDRTLIALTHALNNDMLALPLRYKNTQGQTFNKTLGHLLQHLFNHQTHHRGQVSTLFFQMGIDIGCTDLLMNISDL